MLHIRLGKQICHEVECTDVKLGYCNWWIPSPYFPLGSLIDGAKTLGILVLLLITSFFPLDVVNSVSWNSAMFWCIHVVELSVDYIFALMRQNI